MIPRILYVPLGTLVRPQIVWAHENVGVGTENRKTACPSGSSKAKNFSLINQEPMRTDTRILSSA
jgi:hypothetical protein